MAGKDRRVPPIEIYTKTFCSFCWRAKRLLESKGVEYQEVVIDFGGPDRQVMIERANGRTTVPQIFIDGRHIGGCDDLFALERAGKLDELIAA
jgi:glutaredoxin 3